MLLSHINLFTSEAFIVIGDVYLALFTMRSLKNFVEEKKKVFFLLKIFYFSICLTSNKFYWIEDQLANIFTQFYMLVSWHWRVELWVT